LPQENITCAKKRGKSGTDSKEGKGIHVVRSRGKRTGDGRGPNRREVSLHSGRLIAKQPLRRFLMSLSTSLSACSDLLLKGEGTSGKENSYRRPTTLSHQFRSILSSSSPFVGQSPAPHNKRKVMLKTDVGSAVQ